MHRTGTALVCRNTRPIRTTTTYLPDQRPLRTCQRDAMEEDPASSPSIDSSAVGRLAVARLADGSVAVARLDGLADGLAVGCCADGSAVGGAVALAVAPFGGRKKKETPSVNPSCGRWLALARCHRGGSPRTFQRAASSPRGAQATPHPGKRNDRAPPPPASPRRAAPRLASPRLAAAHAHTHPRARARSARAKQPSKRVPNREPKGPGSNREPVRPPPLAVLAKASKAVPDIT